MNAKFIGAALAAAAVLAVPGGALASKRDDARSMLAA